MGKCVTFKKATASPARQFKAATLRAGSRFNVTLAASCFVSQWVGVSRLMLEWPFDDAPKSFSVEDLLRFSSPQYVLAVRSGGRRCKFWEDVGEDLRYPLYNGETLYEDAVFELWSTETNEEGDFAGFTFYLPTVHISCCKTNTDVTLVAVTPGRVRLCDAPVHNPYVPYGEQPTLVFSITTPLC